MSANTYETRTTRWVFTHKQIGDTIAEIMRRYANQGWAWFRQTDQIDDLRILAKHMESRSDAS